jgi:hypothetical protein
MMELADCSNEQLFGRLIDPVNVTRLVNNVCDLKNPNQAYALNALTAIFKEFPNYEKNIGKQIVLDFTQAVTKSFFDLTYTVLLMLRASDAQLCEAPPVD